MNKFIVKFPFQDAPVNSVVINYINKNFPVNKNNSNKNFNNNNKNFNNNIKNFSNNKNLKNISQINYPNLKG